MKLETCMVLSIVHGIPEISSNFIKVNLFIRIPAKILFDLMNYCSTKKRYPEANSLSRIDPLIFLAVELLIMMRDNLLKCFHFSYNSF